VADATTAGRLAFSLESGSGQPFFLSDAVTGGRMVSAWKGGKQLLSSLLSSQGMRSYELQRLSPKGLWRINHLVRV
jgi:hypothetical protein